MSMQTLQAGWEQKKQAIATVIAIAFHVSGFIAIGFFNSSLFISLTPLNLLVCAALIFWTHGEINLSFVLFCVIAYLFGFASEWVGINTGLLFGEYTYGAVLGPSWQGVPYIIGVQWLVVVYCAGVSMAMLHHRLVVSHSGREQPIPRIWLVISMVADSALIAVIFDWILEPVAIRLGYWTWEGNEVPWLNYASWWGVCALIMVFFQLLPFRKHNLFAVHLLMIQTMFFLLLRAVG